MQNDSAGPILCFATVHLCEFEHIHTAVCICLCVCVRALHSCVKSPQDKNNSVSFLVTAQFLLCAVAWLSASPALPSWTHRRTYTHTHTQSANQRSERGHLCLPGLPGDEEEAVVGGIDPVGASLADHHSASGVSTAAAASVVLQKDSSMFF